jgi:poly-gamma-glutamate synthase PgsB/CapB
MIFTALLLLFLFAYGFWEYRRHQRNLDAVRLRVLVNGTRGKSSVTRLITGGLQRGGKNVLGKTTGTSPRLIYPDGSERAILRAGKANIIEQLMVFRRAVELGVEAVVTECMAVLPPNQIIMQNQLVRSTIGVITNARADHLDEMGPTVEDVARCLARTIPVRGTVFTCEQAQLPILRQEAEARHARLVAVDGSSVTDEMLRGFSYIEHKENVALALAVCESLGVSRGTALEGMYAARPDPGVLRVFTVRFFEKELSFVNAFAANDPDSYILIWDTVRRFAPEDAEVIVIVNCRQDRVQRTESMADLITHRITADHFVLAGESTLPLYNRARTLGLAASRIEDLGGESAEAVFEHVVGLTKHRSLVIGTGNIVGLGEDIVMNFTNRGKEIVY